MSKPKTYVGHIYMYVVIEALELLIVNKVLIK